MDALEIPVVRDRRLPPGCAFLIGQPYDDWRREQPHDADVSLKAWVRACVRRLS